MEGSSALQNIRPPDFSRSNGKLGHRSCMYFCFAAQLSDMNSFIQVTLLLLSVCVTYMSYAQTVSHEDTGTAIGKSSD